MNVKPKVTTFNRTPKGSDGEVQPWFQLGHPPPSDSFWYDTAKTVHFAHHRIDGDNRPQAEFEFVI